MGEKIASRLEISPVPTQKQRKQIKGLPQIRSVEASAGQAWVTHSAYPEEEYLVVGSLRNIGFSVRGYAGFDSVEDSIKNMAKLYKKEKKSRRKRVNRGKQMVVRRRSMG